METKSDTITFEIEKQIRITCRDFIAQLICQLRQRLPKSFNNLTNANFYCVENSLKANKCNLSEHFKEEIIDFTVEEITTLEHQWQKLNSYELLNKNSTVDFWINVYGYKKAINENPFSELASFAIKFWVLPFSNAEVKIGF